MTWILIEYRTKYSSGRIIVKEDLFLKKYKKFMKVLKDSDYHITNPYKLSLDEFINFDKEYIDLDKHKRRLNSYLEYERKHDSCDDWNKTLIEVRNTDKRISTRLMELREIYMKGGNDL